LVLKTAENPLGMQQGSSTLLPLPDPRRQTHKMPSDSCLEHPGQ